MTSNFVFKSEGRGFVIDMMRITFVYEELLLSIEIMVI